MFDSAYITCPCCGEFTEFQSKAGDCKCTDYYNGDIPENIAISLDGQTSKCDKCGVQVTIEYPPRLKGVTVKAIIKRNIDESND